MILVSDAVAEVDQVTHETELRTMARIFADVKTTDKVIGMLDGLDPEGSLDNSGKAIDA